eukprot:XP_001701769.1 predicted protein [Chlamydomonas reinhardtii]
MAAACVPVVAMVVGGTVALIAIRVLRVVMMKLKKSNAVAAGGSVEHDGGQVRWEFLGSGRIEFMGCYVLAPGPTGIECKPLA